MDRKAMNRLSDLTPPPMKKWQVVIDSPQLPERYEFEVDARVETEACRAGPRQRRVDGPGSQSPQPRGSGPGGCPLRRSLGPVNRHRHTDRVEAVNARFERPLTIHDFFARSLIGSSPIAHGYPVSVNPPTVVKRVLAEAGR